MTKEDAIKRLDEQGYIYGGVWGYPLSFREGFVRLDKRDLEVLEDRFSVMLGLSVDEPHQYMLYYYADYDITWSFDKPIGETAV